MLPGAKKKYNFVNLRVLRGKKTTKEQHMEMMLPTKTSELSPRGALGHSEEQKDGLSLFQNIF